MRWLPRLTRRPAVPPDPAPATVVGYGPVDMTRDDVHPGDTSNLSWKVTVPTAMTIRALLEQANDRLPYPQGSQGWVAVLTSPGDRWHWTKSALGVLRPGEVVVSDEDTTVRDHIGAVGWHATIHFAHRPSGAPPASDADLLGYVEHSPDRA